MCVLVRFERGATAAFARLAVVDTTRVLWRGTFAVHLDVEYPTVACLCVDLQLALIAHLDGAACVVAVVARLRDLAVSVHRERTA